MRNLIVLVLTIFLLAGCQSATSNNQSTSSISSLDVTSAAKDIAAGAQLRTKMIADGKINSTNFKVNVENGVVTISGIAKNIEERDAIIGHARKLKFVSSVQNNITLENPKPSVEERLAKVRTIVENSSQQSQTQQTANTNNNQVSNDDSSIEQFNLTEEELVQWVMAGDWYNKAENIFSLGESVGIVQYCPEVNSRRHREITVNAKNWLKLAASESEGVISKDGAYLNSRKYDKLLAIFNDGIARGKRDGKLIRRSRQFKREICPLELNDDELDGPSLRLIGQIR